MDNISIGVTPQIDNVVLNAGVNNQIIDITLIETAEVVNLDITPNLIEINIIRSEGEVQILQFASYSNFPATGKANYFYLAKDTNKLYRWTGSTYAEIGALGYTAENVANKGIANGYAGLDSAGKVPSTQLPSYVDDVIEVANYAALPATGETGKIYITLDTNNIYRWSGSVYVEISTDKAVWGGITGTLANQADLVAALAAKQNNLNGTGYVKSNAGVISYVNETYLTTADAGNTYVPYTGAIADVNLGSNDITAASFVKSGGTSSQFLKADGSVDSTAYAADSNVVHKTGDENIAGIKTFTDFAKLEQNLFIKHDNTTSYLPGYNIIDADASSMIFGLPVGYAARLVLSSLTQARNFTLPDASGTLALTTDIPSLSGYVPTSRTITIDGTTQDLSANRTFTINYPITSFNTRTGAITLSSNDVTTALGFTPYNATNPANYIDASALAPYLLLAGGTMTGALIGTSASYSGNVTALSFIKTGGTSAQFLKADGTVDSSSYVPYTGATANVDLGTHKLSSADLVVNHVSGSGVAASITKGGSGEALTVIKTSGSGNAASITGGVTLLDELHLNTDLADAYIASAATWNAKQDALNGGTGFVKSTAGVISYDGSTYVPTSRTLTINGTAFDLSADRSWTISSYTLPTASTTVLGGVKVDGSTITINGSGVISASGSTYTLPTATDTVLGGVKIGSGVTITSGVISVSTNYQAPLNGGTGFVKSTAGVISYVNETYLTTSAAASTYLTQSSADSTYLPLAGGVVTGELNVTRTAGLGLNVASDNVVFRSNTGVFSPRQLAISMGGGALVQLQAKGYAANYITDFGIQTFNSSGTAFDVFYATSTGNVGIGTTTPSTGYVGGNGSLTLQNSKSIAFQNYTNGWNTTTEGGAITYFTDNNLYIDAKDSASNMIFRVNGDNERMRITSGGSVCIGRTSAPSSAYKAAFQEAIFMAVSTNGNNMVNFFNQSDGYVASIAVNAGSVVYGTGSDYRIKEDFKEFNGLDKLSAIKVYDFKLKQGGERMSGVIAHELQEIIPYAVTGIKDEIDEYGNPKIQNVDYSKIVPVLIQSIKELKQKIDILENK
jgi:hypothetical protein